MKNPNFKLFQQKDCSKLTFYQNSVPCGTLGVPCGTSGEPCGTVLHFNGQIFKYVSYGTQSVPCGTDGIPCGTSDWKTVWNLGSSK